MLLLSSQPTPPSLLLLPSAGHRLENSGNFFLKPMEESEKLTALKKAYAEIILNTTKQAAVRIMESDRKAARLHQELSSVKDESLRMLMRMKQMLDAKNNEATVVCMSQQQKIEELEAQLSEAEDIVKELREELTEVQSELARLKNARRQEEQRGELVPVSDARTSSSYGTHKGSSDCSSRNSCEGYCYCSNPDFASILRRCKEPKLHKNGCTQRIRACEDNSCKEVQETCSKGNEGGDALSGIEKQGNSNMFGDVQFESNKKRKLTTRHSQAEVASSVDHLNYTKETQNPCSRASQDDKPVFLQSDNTDKDFVQPQVNKLVSNPLEKDCAEKTANVLESRNHGEKIEDPMCSKDSLDEGKEFVQSESANTWQLSDKENGFQESRVDGGGDEHGNASQLAHCVADSIKLEGSSLNLDDLKASDSNDGIECQSPDVKFLKYTFQRKRKREVSCSPDPRCYIEEKNAKDDMVEKCNGPLEPTSLSFTNE